ncbi:MAG: hypothetical protein ACI4XA_06105 [Oscillospiraceae bacterium]
MTFSNNAEIKKDRLRYTKNKLSANLALLAIVFNALYFVNIYKSDVGSYYYTLTIGLSVVYNLVFMLTAFLSSEGVKSYKREYSFVLMVLGLGQIVRIFLLPMSAANAVITISDVEEPVMGGEQFMWVCVFLILSAFFCIVSGIIALIKTNTLESYQAELAKKSAEDNEK